MEEINLKEFFSYLKKYIILIMIITVVLVAGVYVYDKIIKKPLYKTYTTIVLVKNDNINYNMTEAIDQDDVLLNKNLITTYGEIIKSKLVLNQVINELDLKTNVAELSKKIIVEPIEDTEILKISVVNENPDTAAEIANSTAEIFNVEIKKIYKMNNVSIIDKAQPNNKIANNTLIKDIILAILAAVFGTSIIVFIKFYFDDTIKYSEHLEKETDMPVIAKIFKDNNKIDLLVSKKPNALASESIRTLRTNLQFASIDKELKTLLITSTLPKEGKSFVSSNLAIAFAQTGKNVLLVDCDLRKGRQHRIFKIQNNKGLSNLLIDNSQVINEYINHTSIKGLSVITRGACPPNPSELLNSKKNKLLIKSLREVYDIVILDGPPCNGLSDSLILSTIVDKVIVISSENYTPKSELKNAKKAIEKVGGEIVGNVINKINIHGNEYGKYYYEDDKK